MGKNELRKKCIIYSHFPFYFFFLSFGFTFKLLCFAVEFSVFLDVDPRTLNRRKNSAKRINFKNV